MLPRPTSLPLLAAAVALCVAAPLPSLHAQTPLSSAFTYQGEIRQAGNPASGTYDLRFRLYDAAAAGAQLGPTLCFDNVPLPASAAGRFSLSLDFGPQFQGSQRFLEIDARPDPGLMADCTNPAGFNTLTPRQPLTATPYALFSTAPWQTDAATGRLSYSAGNVGIGTVSPLRPLHVVNASTFTARFENSNAGVAVFELRNSASNFTWELDVGGTTPPFALPAGTFYIRPTSLAAAALSIDPAGNVGIGTSPSSAARLNVFVPASSYALAAGNNGSTGAFGIAGFANNSADGAGVYGSAAWSGVQGQGGLNGVYGGSGQVGVRGVGGAYGVFANGNLGASGSKPFQIDHPADPENRYLLHYSAESPEVINFYRGLATLDARGEATVTLPAYFSRINTNPSYTLTAVGAPMPMLHIAQEIDPSALAAGNAAPPTTPAPLCSFTIAGGSPGARVSWRVEAQRNDRWLQAHGAPVEADKQPWERGTYQHPELYGHPAEKGMNYHAAGPRPPTP